MARVRSQYWLSEPNALFPGNHPAVVILDARAYTRPEIGALPFGLREEASVALDSRNLPADMSGYAFADDPSGMRSLEYGVPALRRYIPAIDRLGIRGYVAGASTYTPDGLFLAGRAAGIDGLLVASGCCGTGIAASGGYGQLLASLALEIVEPLPSAPFAPGRFGTVDPFDANLRVRCAVSRSRKTAG